MNTNLKRIAMVIPPQHVREVVLGIEAAVRRSAIMRPQLAYTEAHISHDEAKQRAAWCVDWALEVIKATHWPIERLCDELQQRLIDHLDGVERPLDTDMSAWTGGARPGTEGEWNDENSG